MKDLALENVKKKKNLLLTPRKNDFHLEPVKGLALKNEKKKKKNLLLQGIFFKLFKNQSLALYKSKSNHQIN